jgi:hypothetical protein
MPAKPTRNLWLATLIAGLGLTSLAFPVESPASGDLAAQVQALKAVQARHQEDLLDLPGVFGVGIGFGSKRQAALVVLVEKGMPLPALPATLEGYELVVKRAGPIRLQDGFPGCAIPCHANQQALPVQMGNSAYSTLRCSTCTLGFKACDVARGKIVYVTNAHCTRDQNKELAGIASATRHVARGDAPNCGFASIIGAVAGHADPCDPANGTVDASKIDSNFGLTSIAIRDVGFPSSTPVEPMMGMAVQKSGRTTGLTFGEITKVNLTLEVPGTEYACGELTLDEQFEIEPTAPSTVWSMNGDSGSVVLDMAGHPVGLLFAGADDGSVGWANEIDNVLAELGLSLNFLSCVEDCAFTRASSGLAHAVELLELGHRFRDEVLARTSRGLQYIRLYEQHSPELVRLMVADPDLLIQTGNLLELHRTTLGAMVRRAPAVVTSADLYELDRLLVEFATVASSGLQSALDGLRKDIRNSAVQKDFGVEVID